MKNQFHELTKNLAQAVTRRQAFKTFGLGLTGIALARLGLNEAQAITNGQLDGNAHPNVGGFVWRKNIFPPEYAAAPPLVPRPAVRTTYPGRSRDSLPSP